jgi:hypothetical protein
MIISRRNFSQIEMFETKFLVKIKTHFVFSNLFSESRAVYEKMWKKFCRAGKATDESTARLQTHTQNA